ncbi:hypothetical protein HPB48_022762 [Haemaphysalis longicornis]|uniref:Uncharacterized protein n=1 Tax=Haemaphysalis longicornis TaxID=44386 RepID=A0A9J6FBW1_HAELO|nr:hypothetical protein HPB48_022762 [Haemaphysalis longicornis]
MPFTPHRMQVCKCSNLVYFEVKDETMKSRLMKRGETSGRVDDNEETIAKRIKTFHDESEPVLEKYKSILHKVSVCAKQAGLELAQFRW